MIPILTATIPRKASLKEIRQPSKDILRQQLDTVVYGNSTTIPDTCEIEVNTSFELDRAQIDTISIAGKLFANSRELDELETRVLAKTYDQQLKKTPTLPGRK